MFIFLGRSGSGKGTQLELLKKYIGGIDTEHAQFDFGMGDAYRAFFKSESYIAGIAKELTNAGNFQPDFLTNALFVSYLANHIPENAHLFIEGFPRSQGQLEAVMSLAAYAKLPKPIFIDVDVSETEVRKRLLGRGRTDDVDDAINKRLSEYTRAVVPLILQLKSDDQYVYWHIDGERSIETIHEDIISKIKEII